MNKNFNIVTKPVDAIYLFNYISNAEIKSL